MYFKTVLDWNHWNVQVVCACVVCWLNFRIKQNDYSYDLPHKNRFLVVFTLCHSYILLAIIKNQSRFDTSWSERSSTFFFERTLICNFQASKMLIWYFIEHCLPLLASTEKPGRPIGAPAPPNIILFCWFWRFWTKSGGTEGQGG